MGAPVTASLVASVLEPGRFYAVAEVQRRLVCRARVLVGRRSLRQRLRWMAERGEIERASILSGNAAIYRRTR